jgi:hypothetical protein
MLTSANSRIIETLIGAYIPEGTIMSNDNGRDERGRWKKGFCPNPNGRPRKQPRTSEADINYFRNTAVEVTINGERRLVTRHELLVNAMFDKAIKGNVTMQRELFRRFEKSDEIYAEAFDYLCELERRFVYDSENKELEREVRKMRYLLGGDPDCLMGRPPRREPRKRKRKAVEAPKPPLNEEPTTCAPDEKS